MAVRAAPSRRYRYLHGIRRCRDIEGARRVGDWLADALKQVSGSARVADEAVSGGVVWQVRIAVLQLPIVAIGTWPAESLDFGPRELRNRHPDPVREHSPDLFMQLRPPLGDIGRSSAPPDRHVEAYC